jgi:hypothetical protein
VRCIQDINRDEVGIPMLIEISPNNDTMMDHGKEWARPMRQNGVTKVIHHGIMVKWFQIIVQQH